MAVNAVRVVFSVGSRLRGLAPILGAILRFERLDKERMVGTLGFFGFAALIFATLAMAFWTASCVGGDGSATRTVFEARFVFARRLASATMACICSEDLMAW